jgi:hypothetical protein
MFPSFDPSKLDPKTLMELSQLIRELPPEQISRLQALMHNMGAGFDVKRELEDFEKSLPQGFRDRMTALMLKAQTQTAAAAPAHPGAAAESATDLPGSVREARLTVLRAVADGHMPPEEAERVLFPEN